MNPDNRPTLRRSQLITTFGVGAIANLADESGRGADASVMICGLDIQIEKRTKGWRVIRDKRLEEKLGVACFKMPPDKDNPRQGMGVWSVRFPRWLRCRNRNHGLLMPVEEFRNLASSNPRRNFDQQPYCFQDNLTLVPSGFVVACKAGHADDFPYINWVHKGPQHCDKPQLTFKEMGATGTLSDIHITCTCGADRTMVGAFNEDTLNAVASCNGAMPWRNVWKSSCGGRIRTLQRGATNVHFPVIKSSILIPPFSQESLKAEIQNTDWWDKYSTSEGLLQIDQVIPKIASELGMPLEKVEPIIRSLDGESASEPIEKSEEEYRAEEYAAFLSGSSDPSLKEDFLIDGSESDKYGVPGISRIVLAQRLREIRVQTHFTRISLPGPSEDGSSDGDEAQLVPVNENRSIDWRPAYEVHGEGIFIEFDQKTLSEWSSKDEVKARLKTLLERSERNPDAFGIVSKLTPELLLLHSFSHALIRQLSFECGYSSASLRERLYCSADQSSRPMAGVLIYTAAGDADGTLGGLVRQGRKDAFPEILRQSLLSAQWCSTDPLCITSQGQGFAALNLAACYSCSMLPETSCELLNRYLDRGTLIGNLEDRGSGYFSDWVEST